MDKIDDRCKIDWMQLENRIKATPLDLLRQGIMRKQWEAIELSYTMLTGEKLCTQTTELAPVSAAPPAVEVKRKRGRLKKVEIHATPVVSPPAPVPTPITTLGVPADCIAPSKAPGQQNKVKNFGNFAPHDTNTRRENKFVDNKTEIVDEIVENRQVPNDILTASRPPTQNIKMKCQGCGQTYDIDVSLAPHAYRLTKNYSMRWLCNNCVTGAKSGQEIEAAVGDDDDLLAD